MVVATSRAISSWAGRDSKRGHRRPSAPPAPSSSSTRDGIVTLRFAWPRGRSTLSSSYIVVRAAGAQPGATLSEATLEQQVQLALERRAAGLEPVVHADAPGARVEPHAHADSGLPQTLEALLPGRRCEPGLHPGLIDEGEDALAVRPGEQARLAAQEHVTI